MKSRMFLQKAGRFFLALVCALSLLGSVAAAPAASRKSGAEVISPLLYVEKVQRSNVLPQAEGTFARVKKLQKVPVGEIESFLVTLRASEQAPEGESATVTLTAEHYDFTNCTPVLLIPVDDTYYVRRLSGGEGKEGQMSVDVRAEYLGVNAKSPVYLYVEGTKNKKGGTVKATVERCRETAFAFGTSIAVGSYLIEKQGGEAMPVQVALGMAGMDEKDTVYLVSDGKTGKEVLRLVVKDGALLGIAREENGLVMSLEYSLEKKCYVSVLTRKKLLDKATVLDVFQTLDVSFVKAPDEERWLEAQTIYSTSKTVRLKG